MKELRGPSSGILLARLRLLEGNSDDPQQWWISGASPIRVVHTSLHPRELLSAYAGQSADQRSPFGAAT